MQVLRKNWARIDQVYSNFLQVASFTTSFHVTSEAFQTWSSPEFRAVLMIWGINDHWSRFRGRFRPGVEIIYQNSSIRTPNMTFWEANSPRKVLDKTATRKHSEYYSTVSLCRNYYLLWAAQQAAGSLQAGKWEIKMEYKLNFVKQSLPRPTENHYLQPGALQPEIMISCCHS